MILQRLQRASWHGMVLLVGASAIASAGESPPSLLVSVKASSSQPERPPRQATTGNLGSSQAWCSKAGDGTGESITFSFDAPTALAALSIVSGYSVLPDQKGERSFPDRLEVTAGAQRLVVTPQPHAFTEVRLDGSAVSAVQVKLLSVKPGRRAGACISAVRFLAPGGMYYPIVVDVDRATFDTLPAFLRRVDQGLRSCDSELLQSSVALPLQHNHTKVSPQDAERGSSPTRSTYKTIAAIAEACWHGDGLRSGYRGYDDDADLDKDAARATSLEGGELQIGSSNRHAFQVARKSDGWRLLRVDTSESYGSGEAARDANARGMRLYKTKDYVGATAAFRAALAVDSRQVLAHYNLACTLALLGDKPGAIGELGWLAASADPVARSRIEKAKTDADLVSVRDEPRVRELLGVDALPAADAPERLKAWLDGPLSGNDNDMAKMRIATISRTNVGGYEVFIKNQMGFRCGLTFSPAGSPAALSHCVAGESGWRASPDSIALRCRLDVRAQREHCEGAYRLQSDNMDDPAVFTLERKLK